MNSFSVLTLLRYGLFHIIPADAQTILGPVGLHYSHIIEDVLLHNNLKETIMYHKILNLLMLARTKLQIKEHGKIKWIEYDLISKPDRFSLVDGHMMNRFFRHL